MKNSFGNAAIKGVLAGVILIFLELINMTAALGIMLEKLLTSNDKVKTSSPAFYAGVVALVAFFVALSYIRSLYRPGAGKPSLGRSLGQSLLLGVCAGVLIAALNAVLGRLNADGVKIRAYLDMMSPDAIRTAAFGLEIPRMIAVYIGLTAAGALCGGVLAWILKTTDQPAKSWRALQKSVAGNEAIRRIRRNKTVRMTFPVIVILLCLALPLVLSPYGISVLGLILIYAILGLGLNLNVGL